MNSIFSLVVVIQVLSAVAIIGLVLVQHGKGADMGAAFGSGASGSLFGATGSSSFLTKATAVAAFLFFSSTLSLAYFANRHTAPSGSVMDTLSAPVQTKTVDAPAASSAPTATPAKPTGKADQIPK